MAHVEVNIPSDGLALKGYLARPDDDNSSNRALHGLVVTHGFPARHRGAVTFGQTYPELADRLASEAEWVAVSVELRGTGSSEGEFSLGGWLRDIHAAVAFLRAESDVSGISLAGFGTGGGLSICAAADDETIQGVAAFACPADFSDWASNPQRLLDRARSMGAIHSSDFPPDFSAWSTELSELRPVTSIAKIPPRPVLVVHGSEDDLVPVAEARALADAAGPSCELRVLGGGGHDLRIDPRAVAVLLGWLDRQSA